MKYIPADKLIAEIKRRIDSWSICGENSPEGQGRGTCESRVTELSDLLSFITSLRQERPEVEINLGNEVENFCLEYDARKDAWYNMTPRDQKLLSNPTWLNFATNIARHFYELGLNTRKEK